MATASTLSSVAYLYKKLYGEGVGEAALRFHPLLSSVPKRANWVGDGTFNYAVRYGNTQGIGGTLAKAQANATGSKGLQFAAQRVARYGVITLSGEALLASKGDKGALATLVTTETDSIISEFLDSKGFDLYRDGTGKRGQRGSINSNTVTLKVVDDARNFKIGMTVVASPNADGSSARTGSTTITAVDEDAGKITLASAAAIASFANDDYLFRDGDIGACIEGLEALNPLTAPSPSESFRGKDRSVDARRLAGCRLNDTATTIEENAGRVATFISQAGKKADAVYLNPVPFYALVRRLNAKIEYSQGGGTATHGFEHVVIATPGGILKAYSDPDCPVDRGRVITSDELYLKSLGEVPHIIDDDGMSMLRQTADDGLEQRVRSFDNLILETPSSFGCFAI